MDTKNPLDTNVHNYSAILNKIVLSIQGHIFHVASKTSTPGDTETRINYANDEGKPMDVSKTKTVRTPCWSVTCHFIMLLDKKNSIYTSIVLRIIRYLGIFPCINQRNDKKTVKRKKKENSICSCSRVWKGQTYPIQLYQLVSQDLIHWHWPDIHNEEKLVIQIIPNKNSISWQYHSMWENVTSMIVPLVITPRDVYIGPLGFFFTPMISRLKVHLSSGWVTWALVKRNPEGRMKRSYLGGFLVKPGPTNVTLVTILFHCFAAKAKIRSALWKAIVEGLVCNYLPKLSNKYFHISWQTEPQKERESIYICTKSTST